MIYAVQILAAFFGSMGYSLIYNTRRTKMLISSLGGAIGWGVYLLVTNFVADSVPLAYFIAAMCMQISRPTSSSPSSRRSRTADLWSWCR